jgi:hypothetical protein
MSNARKHMKAYCLLQMFLDGLKQLVTHREILRMRVYRIPSREFLVVCGLYLASSRLLDSSPVPVAFKCRKEQVSKNKLNSKAFVKLQLKQRTAKGGHLYVQPPNWRGIRNIINLSGKT